MDNILVDKNILIFAFRYALGRQTFAPSIVVENIQNNIHKLDNNIIDIMLKDIEEHPFSLGMDCDRRTWANLVDFLNETKKSRG